MVMSGIKKHWKDVEAIKAETGCTTKEAKARLRAGKDEHGGDMVAVRQPLPPMSPADIKDYSRMKQKELTGKISAAEQNLEAMKSELTEWEAIESCAPVEA